MADKMKVKLTSTVLCPIEKTVEISKCEIGVGTTKVPEFMKKNNVNKSQENDMIV